MSIEQTEPLRHWNYFLSLEQDLESLSRSIEFHEDNFEVFSTNLWRILFAAASEVDVVARMMCSRFKGKVKADNIVKYRKAFLKVYPYFPDVQVVMSRHGLHLQPWSNWKAVQSPEWWRAYNNNKHERNQYFRQANLKNSLNSVAGLFVMLIHFHMDLAREGKLLPEPQLFRVEGTMNGGLTFWGEKATHYIFPYVVEKKSKASNEGASQEGNRNSSES